MNWLIFSLMWLAVPMAYLLIKEVKAASVRKKRVHDLILYSFCEVRDAMAMKALKGEVDEDSEVFRFFYGKVASLVHHHRNQGLCFNKLARHMVRTSSSAPISSRTKMLVRQLKKSDDDVKAIAALFVQACTAMMAEASLRARIERRVWNIWSARISFLTWLEKLILIPREEREFAALTDSVAKAAHYTPRPWTAVIDLARAHAQIHIPVAA